MERAQLGLDQWHRVRYWRIGGGSLGELESIFSHHGPDCHLHDLASTVVIAGMTVTAGKIATT